MNDKNTRVEVIALEKMITRISYLAQMCECGELKELDKYTDYACQIATTLDQIRVNERANWTLEEVEEE